MRRILYLEDDLIIHDATKEFMLMYGYKVTSAYDGQEALNYLKTNKFDLVILDILTPHITGLEVLMYMKKNKIEIPIIMLSALGDEKSQLTAFDLNADDYIIKPFSANLLLKRIEAILRRSDNRQQKTSGLLIDKDGYRVLYNNVDLSLTITEYLIFTKLHDNAHLVFTREMLLELIFEEDYLVNDRIIDAHIKNLRKKLPQKLIKTIVGVGYKYESE